MAKVVLNNTSVKGISSVVPLKEMSLIDEPNLYNGNKDKITRVIESSGFLKRRIADENTTTADLCEYAANNLLEALKVRKESIDGLLFISYTPDYLMPATSYVLHKKLGLSEECVVADIPQACSGFVFGLYQAAMMLNSGCKKILLLVGDTFSKFSDMFRNNSAPIFGDAGSATLLEYDENATPIYFNIKSKGEAYDALVCGNGAFRNKTKPDMFYKDGQYMYDSKMDGAKIFNFTLDNIALSITDLLDFATMKVEHIDQFVLHQANKFILQNIALQLGIDSSNIPSETLSKYGNQCGASIPCTICDVLKERVSTSNNKYLLSGFGVGLSWISSIIDFNNIYCSNIIEYKS